MTTATIERIPDGSHAVRVFSDRQEPGKTPYETVLAFYHVEPGVAEAALLHGTLYTEALRAIARCAESVGIEEVRFEALPAQKVTHFARRIKGKPGSTLLHYSVRPAEVLR